MGQHGKNRQLQLFETKTGQQLWSAVFDRVITKSNALALQDELVKEMSASIGETLSLVCRRK
jgi:TolB-like protein